MKIWFHERQNIRPWSPHRARSQYPEHNKVVQLTIVSLVNRHDIHENKSETERRLKLILWEFESDALLSTSGLIISAGRTAARSMP